MLRRRTGSPTPPDESALLERLRRRDEAAFRELVGRHHQALVALALTVVRERATAEEVVQDTWIAVLNGIERFEGRSRLSTWIGAILLNKARGRAERDGRLRSFSDLFPGDAGGDAIDPERFLADGHWAEPVALWDEIDPERIIGGRELWRHVLAEIDALPPGQRAVVLLRDVQDVPQDEVCRLLGLSEANGRVLLHRARARLRDVIARLGAHAPVKGKARGPA